MTLKSFNLYNSLFRESVFFIKKSKVDGKRGFQVAKENFEQSKVWKTVRQQLELVVSKIQVPTFVCQFLSDEEIVNISLGHEI